MYPPGHLYRESYDQRRIKKLEQDMAEIRESQECRQISSMNNMKISENGTYTPKANEDNRVQWLQVDEANCSVGDKFSVSGISKAMVIDGEIKVLGDFVITVINVRDNEVMITPPIISEGVYRTSTGMYLDGMELIKI